MEKYMTSHLFDVIVYRQSDCYYRKIIAVPSYGLTVGKNNAYANITLCIIITFRISTMPLADNRYKNGNNVTSSSNNVATFRSKAQQSLINSVFVFLLYILSSLLLLK